MNENTIRDFYPWEYDNEKIRGYRVNPYFFVRDEIEISPELFNEVVNGFASCEKFKGVVITSTPIGLSDARRLIPSSSAIYDCPDDFSPSCKVLDAFWSEITEWPPRDVALEARKVRFERLRKIFIKRNK